MPVRTKTGLDVANAFEKILIDGTPNMVLSDKGTVFEFHVSEHVETYSHKILHERKRRLESQRGTDIQQDVENENVSLFHNIHKNTRRYVDVLDDMLHSYNNTYHSSIGMARRK